MINYIKKITVFCGSNNGSDTKYRKAALDLGQTLAKNDIELIYGGASVGLMGAIADSVIESGGKATGVLPSFLKRRELEQQNLTEIIIVETMHERKAKMNELCDGIIALPGGFGTLEELFEMLTWAQLALHKKPIGLLNIDGYYNTLLTFIDEMIEKNFVKEEYRNLILVSENPSELINKMKSYEAPLNDKWFVTN